jgi:FkbM family methyltransferase
MLQRAIGLYEVKKHKALQTFLKPGGSFIDIGANKGDFSLLAAKLVGGDGKVLAFEPEPENCKWIEKSIQINGYKNIMLYEIALSDQNGEAKLFMSTLSGLHSLIPDLEYRDRGAIDVKIRTLDAFLKETGFAHPFDVIKIDVEGAELQVLHGAFHTLSMSNNLVLLIDIHPRLGVDPKEVCDFLVKQGFAIFHEKPPFSSPVTKYSNLTSIIARRVP